MFRNKNCGTTKTRFDALMCAASKGLRRNVARGPPRCAAIPGDLPFTGTKLKRERSHVAHSNLDGCPLSGRPRRIQALLLIGGSRRAGISGVLLFYAGRSCKPNPLSLLQCFAALQQRCPASLEPSEQHPQPFLPSTPKTKPADYSIYSQSASFKKDRSLLQVLRFSPS